jgi:ABC-2 type transport system permease protein
MVAAALLSAAIATLMTTTLLWTVSGEGIWQLLALTMWLFSGTLIPLPFFPEWLQPLVNALPFRGLMDVPFRIWSGHIPPSAVIPNLASVVGWTVALIGLGRLLIARGTRKLVVQGG